VQTYHTLTINGLVEIEEEGEMQRLVDEASRIAYTDPRFDGVYSAAHGDDEERFISEFVLLSDPLKYNLAVRTDIPPILGEQSCIFSMMSHVLQNHDLGEDFFSLCVRRDCDCSDQSDFFGRILVNPHLPIHLLLCMFPFERTIEQCGFDDEMLIGLASRWDEVSAILSEPRFEMCDGTIREAEALIRHGTRMRIALRAGDVREALSIAIGTDDVEIYKDALRFSMPEWIASARFPRNETGAYEAHLLMRAGMVPADIRAIDPGRNKGGYLGYSPKADHLRIVYENTSRVHTDLVESIRMMSVKRDAEEIDELVIEYARRSNDVVGGFERDEMIPSDAARISEWLASDDPFVVAFCCAMMDPRVSSGHISLSTSLSHIRGEWEERSPVISSYFGGYDAEMRGNMFNPIFVVSQMEKYGGLSGREVHMQDLLSDLFLSLPDEMFFYHGTSQTRYDQGLPEKGVAPIREIGIVSSKRMMNEDYEERNDNLDVVFVSSDPSCAAGYAHKTVSQDAVRGVETTPILLVCRLVREEVFEYHEMQKTRPSLAEALVSLSESTWDSQDIPMVIVRPEIPPMAIECVIDISRMISEDDEKNSGDEEDVISLIPEEFRPYRNMKSLPRW